MKLLIDEYTDTGKQRSINEDYCGKWHNRLIGGYLFCVADGMGGYGFGDVASKIAVYSAVKDFALLKTNHIALEELVLKMFNNVQNRLKKYRIEKQIDLFGTTLSVLIFINNHWICANIGDTRIYSSKENRLTLESFDHNFVQELLHAGEITAEEAKHHPKKHILTRALTGDDTINVDPFINIQPFLPDQSFLIASDGLYRMLNEREMDELITAYGQGRSVEPVLQKVYDKGATDNITYQVIRPDVKK